MDPLPLLLAGSRHVLSDFTDDPCCGVGVDLGVVTRGARGPSCQSLSALCLQSRGLDGVAEGETAAVVARLLRSRGVTGVSCLPANKGSIAGGGTEGDGGLPRTEGEDISLNTLLPLGAGMGSTNAAAEAVSRRTSCDGSHADMRAIISKGTGPSRYGEDGDCIDARGGECRDIGNSLRISRSGMGGDKGEPGVPSRNCNSFGVGGCGDIATLGNAGLIDALVADVGRAEVSAEASESASADVARVAIVGVFNSNWGCFVDAASAHVACRLGGWQHVRGSAEDRELLATDVRGGDASLPPLTGSLCVTSGCRMLVGVPYLICCCCCFGCAVFVLPPPRPPPAEGSLGVEGTGLPFVSFTLTPCSCVSFAP